MEGGGWAPRWKEEGEEPRNVKGLTNAEGLMSRLLLGEA